MAITSRYGAASVIASSALAGMLAFAQTTVQPLRTIPAEKLTVKGGFRDWSPVTITGTTILGGNQTGAGGMFAFDAASGKLKWSFKPVFHGTAGLSTAPAVSGGTTIGAFSAGSPGAVIAVSIATGKELWRAAEPDTHAAVVANAGLAYFLSKTGTFYALDAATGRETWKAALTSKGAPCASSPIVNEDTVYFTGSDAATPGDAKKPQGYYLFAFDAKTGKEQWRYRAEAPYVNAGVCLHQPVLSGDTIYGAGEDYLYAINRTTGRDRWKPFEVRRPVEGRDRAVDVMSLVDAGPVLMGITSVSLIAFDKATGKTAWELPGTYAEGTKNMATAGDVLYFQGSPGTLRALDLKTHSILWSFSRPTPEPNWPFGRVTPVDGALWVDSYQALVKLQ